MIIDLIRYRFFPNLSCFPIRNENCMHFSVLYPRQLNSPSYSLASSGMIKT